MHSEPDQRLSSPQTRQRPYLWPSVAVVLIVAAIIYFYRAETPQPQPTAPAAPTVIEALAPAKVELPPAPDIPAAVVESQPVTAQVPAPVELTPAENDQALHRELASADDGSTFNALFALDNLIQRSASAVDSLSRGLLPYKALPLKAPTEKFSTVSSDGQEFMNPAGYHRYDAYASAIAKLDSDTLVAAFVQFRPLLEQAYGALGYPEQDFDNSLIRSLDRILATPEIHDPIAVERNEAIYQLADEELEALTDLQKLLLRTGPDNLALIKEQARALRAGLLGS